MVKLLFSGLLGINLLALVYESMKDSTSVELFICTCLYLIVIRLFNND